MEFVTLSLMLKATSAKDLPWLNFPFVEVIAVFLFVALFLVQTLVLMPLFWLIARTQLRIYCFVTAAAYFNGAFLTILWTLPVLVVGGMISVLGLDSDCFALQSIRNCGIVLCLPVFLLGFVVLAGAIATLVGFINWLSLSHAVTRLRVTLAYLAYIAVCFALISLPSLGLVQYGANS